MDVLIDNQHEQHKIDLEEIRKTAEIILNTLDKAETELSILITDDLKIAELNKRYLNRQGPTNVIAFPMQAGEFIQVNPYLLGDVVISADTAAKEGQSAGIGTAMRFRELLVHGILHLCGYDHEESELEALRMEKRANLLLQTIEKRLK
ncbi:rRNA maturation RNase YbeY [Desulfococcaceae bacterium HSG9]|nr:rRNA maturation RNase YbeY [Desulfococcaceae bacterium HSG9]